MVEPGDNGDQWVGQVRFYTQSSREPPGAACGVEQPSGGEFDSAAPDLDVHTPTMPCSTEVTGPGSPKHLSPCGLCGIDEIGVETGPIHVPAMPASRKEEISLDRFVRVPSGDHPGRGQAVAGGDGVPQTESYEPSRRLWREGLTDPAKVVARPL